MRVSLYKCREGKGFTLVETLMAIGISSLLLGTLAIAIYQFVRLTGDYQHSFSAGGDLQNIATLLNQDIVSAESGQVITTEDGAQLTLTIRQVTEDSFGEPTLPAPIYITYTYTMGMGGAGTLIREENGSERVISRNIQSMGFGPSRVITSTVWVTVTVRVEDQSQSAAFVFKRRTSE